MCDYCRDGALRSGKIPVIDVNLDMGILGKSLLAMYIVGRSQGVFLDLSMDSYGVGGRTVRKAQKIYYCPFCGNALEE